MNRGTPKTGFLNRVGRHKSIAMKKALIPLAAVIIVLSCQKNITERPDPPTQNLIKAVIENGHVVLQSSNDFDLLLQNWAGKVNRFVKNLPGYENFISFKESRHRSSAQRDGDCEVPDTLIEENPDLFSLLDEDGVMQIDSHLYRYDYCNQLVWVISAANALNTTYYGYFLNGTLTTGIVGAFPTYVDVTVAVDSGFTTMPDSATAACYEMFENTGGIVNELFGFEDKSLEELYRLVSSSSETTRFDGKMAYQGFGLYFHFYGKEKYQEQCFFNWCTSTGGPRDWYVKFQYSYVRKGNSSPTTGSGTLFPPGSGENKVDKEFYGGRRALKRNSRFAQWDVGHILAYHVNVQRNGGTYWQTIFNYTVSPPDYITNYTGPNFQVIHYVYAG